AARAQLRSAFEADLEEVSVGGAADEGGVLVLAAAASGDGDGVEAGPRLTARRRRQFPVHFGELARGALVTVEVPGRAAGVGVAADDGDGPRHLARVVDLPAAGAVDVLGVHRRLEGAITRDGPMILDLAALQIEDEEVPVRPGVADDLPALVEMSKGIDAL